MASIKTVILFAIIAIAAFNLITPIEAAPEATPKPSADPYSQLVKGIFNILLTNLPFQQPKPACP